ncbi:MAG: hypothetical protein IH597_06420 [Bacteroidales bacterium]|nr:hypothetical protein [Bacteroidales bacterium]
MTDIEIVREVIELFVVDYFETIEMSGTVKAEKRDSINYLRIDLTDLVEDKNLDKLHHSLIKYLRDWVQKCSINFNDFVSISRLTIEYILPVKDGVNQNQSKHVKLLDLPAYYYQANKKNYEKPYSWLLLKVLIIWHNTLLRNTIITLLPTILLIVISVYKIRTDIEFHERLVKSYDYINIASGVIASFVLGFLINKVITIRQDKLKYTRAIRNLSNKLTYFRNICFNLTRDHGFWKEGNKYYKSYEYANSIKHDITFEEYYYPNYDNTIDYARFKSFYRRDMYNNVVSLVLQLHMMADDSFLRSGLSYTKFPPNHIYAHDEMKNFTLFCDTNQIWYCCSEAKIFPDNFDSSYHIKEIVEDINRIYPKKKIEKLSKDRLEEVSLDFQYRIIPSLFNLTRIVDLNLPLSIRYFLTTFTLLLAFGLIIPSLTYIFIGNTFAFLSLFTVIGIIGHILLTLKTILKTENTLDRKYDYL